MNSNDVIGKVTATERQPTTCTTLQFWLKEDVIIRPFDIVRIEHIGHEPEDPCYTYAVVRELSYITDSPGHLSNFVSSDFGDINSEPLNRRLGTTIAEADVLGNSKHIEMPIRDGAKVQWANADEIRNALGISNLKKPIPAGYMHTSNGQEIRIDFESAYFIGPESAHLNISGISGLASKTSYAMFLISALQQRCGADISIVIFNVKGADLLGIDLENKELDEAQKQDWAKCSLEPAPLKNVTYLYPYSRTQPNFTSSRVPPDVLVSQVERGIAYNYYYDVETFKGGDTGDNPDEGREKLSLLFADIEDPSITMDSCIQALAEFSADTWDVLREEIRKQTEPGQKGKEISVQSWRKFSRLVRTRTVHDVFTDRSFDESRRHILIIDAIKQLKAGSVLVVDIEPLPDYLQNLVVGDVIKSVFDAKLNLYEDAESSTLGKVLIFSDELNKYAPSSGGGRDRTLTRWLLEITERGRSLGLVLLGAEQFRSDVHPRVLGNCSSNAYGRTNPVEISKAADYKHSFSASNKSTLQQLKQGQMLIQHAIFNTSLIKVTFPYPAYLQLKG